MSNDEIIQKYGDFLRTELNIPVRDSLLREAMVEHFLRWCELEEIKLVMPEE